MAISEPTPPVPAPVKIPAQPKVVVVQAVKLTTELAMAALGAIIAGLGAFTGALTVTSASNTQALKTAGISAAFVAVTFFTNSLRNWYGQQTNSAP